MISLSFLFASYIPYVELKQTVTQKYQHIQRKRAHKRLSSFLRGPGKTENFQEITILFQSNTKREGGNCDQTPIHIRKSQKRNLEFHSQDTIGRYLGTSARVASEMTKWKLDFESFCLVTSTTPMKYQMRLHKKPEFQYPPNTDKVPQFVSARVASEEAQ